MLTALLLLAAWAMLAALLLAAWAMLAALILHMAWAMLAALLLLAAWAMLAALLLVAWSVIAENIFYAANSIITTSLPFSTQMISHLRASSSLSNYNASVKIQAMMKMPMRLLKIMKMTARMGTMTSTPSCLWLALL